MTMIDETETITKTPRISGGETSPLEPTKNSTTRLALSRKD